MIRLFLYCVAFGSLACLVARSIAVRADSLALVFAGLCLWLLVLIVRTIRREHRRLTRRRTDFIRPRGGFPPQRKRDIR